MPLIGTAVMSTGVSPATIHTLTSSTTAITRLSANHGASVGTGRSL